MYYKKYNIVFIITLLVFLVFVIITEFLVREMPNVYGFKAHELLKNDGHFKTLILGTSHTYFGVNSDYLSDSSFNAAYPFQGLNYDRYILESNLQNLDDLEVVILPISIFSLFSDVDAGGFGADRIYNYRHWFGYSEYAPEEYYNIKTHSVFLANGSKFSLLKDLVNYYFSKDHIEITWPKSGWGTEYARTATEKQLGRGGKAAATRHQNQNEKHLNENMLYNLTKIIEICEKNNLRLLMITTPAYFTYRLHLDDARIEKMTTVVNELSDSSDNIKYLNFLADKRFVMSDYYDVDHLNHKGAKKFTQIIDQALEKWKEQQSTKD